MTKRETRVINAFINCVRTGEYSEDYAILLIEDNQRFGWLSDAAKEVFYDWLEHGDPEPEPEPEPAPEPEPEPEPEPKPDEEVNDENGE